MIDWSTRATWGRGEAAERAVYASRSLDMGDGEDRGYGKLGDGKRTEKATAKSGEVGGNSCGVVWASDTESWAMRGLVRGEEDEGAKAGAGGGGDGNQMR